MENVHQAELFTTTAMLAQRKEKTNTLSSYGQYNLGQKKDLAEPTWEVGSDLYRKVF